MIKSQYEISGLIHAWKIIGDPYDFRGCVGLKFSQFTKHMIKIIPTLNKKGFTLIELMIVIAIIGILAAIAIPNFISYRNKTYCADTESDANNLEASVADYFSIPTHTSIASGDQSFVPPVNNYNITTDVNGVITIQVTDPSSRCPAKYTNNYPVDLAGNGWLNNSTFQRVLSSQ